MTITTTSQGSVGADASPVKAPTTLKPAPSRDAADAQPKDADVTPMVLTADGTDTVARQEPIDDTNTKCGPTVKDDGKGETMAGSENAAAQAATTDKVDAEVHGTVDAAATANPDSVTPATDAIISKEKMVDSNDANEDAAVPCPVEDKSSPQKRPLDEAEAAIAPGSDEKRQKQKE